MYDTEILRLAAVRERYALALLAGTVDAGEALPEMRAVSHRLTVLRDAAALTAYRSGEPVWCWPARAPWAGF